MGRGEAQRGLGSEVTPSAAGVEVGPGECGPKMAASGRGGGLEPGSGGQRGGAGAEPVGRHLPAPAAAMIAFDRCHAFPETALPTSWPPSLLVALSLHRRGNTVTSSWRTEERRELSWCDLCHHTWPFFPASG